MYFTLIGYDAPDAQEKRPIYREDHLKLWKGLEQQGRLLLAGPFEDKSGGLIIFEAADPEEGAAIAQQDPYIQNGVFARYDLKEFRKVLPEPAS